MYKHFKDDLLLTVPDVAVIWLLLSHHLILILAKWRSDGKKFCSRSRSAIRVMTGKESGHIGSREQEGAVIWMIKDEFILLGKLYENKGAAFASGLVGEKEERKREQWKDGGEKKCIIQMMNYGCEPMMSEWSHIGVRFLDICLLGHALHKVVTFL